MTTDYTAIYHPITKRFVCKIDMARGIMFVKDRGREAYIDLTQLASGGYSQTDSNKTGQSVICYPQATEKG